MKKNSIRQTELISLLLILFPVLTGIFLYNRLPQKMATHFGMTNMPNAFSINYGSLLVCLFWELFFK